MSILWKWESDSGDKFNDFSDEHCKLLEQAFSSGQPRLDMPERGWIFDLKRMTQTKVGGTSRNIKRCKDAPSRSAHAQMTQPSSSVQLPAGWTCQYLADGRVFYVNSLTNESQWDLPVSSGVAAHTPQSAATLPPAAMQPAVSAGSLPPGWIENVEPSTKRVFYINLETHQSQWEHPGKPASTQQADAANPAMAAPLAFAPASQPASYQYSHAQPPAPQAVSQQFDHHHASSGASASLQAPAPYVLPAPWTEHFDPVSGRTFYANAQTNQTSWDKPSAAIQHSAAAVPPVPSQQGQAAPAHHGPYPSAATAHAQGQHSASHAAPQSNFRVAAAGRSPQSLATPVIWKWESDSGDKFNDFSDEHCKLLEQAFSSGQPRLDMPERGWIFDLKRMTQTKVGGTSRTIKRFAESSSPVTPVTTAVPQQPSSMPPDHLSSKHAQLGGMALPCAPSAPSNPSVSSHSQLYAPPPHGHAPTPGAPALSSMASLQHALPHQTSYPPPPGPPPSQAQQLYAPPPSGNWPPPSGAPPPPAHQQAYAPPPLAHQQVYAPPPPAHQQVYAPPSHGAPPGSHQPVDYLPAGWHSETMPDGRVLYCHDASGRQSFDRPTK